MLHRGLRPVVRLLRLAAVLSLSAFGDDDFRVTARPTGPNLDLEFPSATSIYHQIWATGCLTCQWELVRGITLGAEEELAWTDAGAVDTFTALYYRVKSIPIATPDDFDQDGLDDVYEMYHPPLDALKADTDNDGLKDGEELTVHGTDPTKSDTDGDGFNDGTEVACASGPLDVADSPSFSIRITEPSDKAILSFNASSVARPPRHQYRIRGLAPQASTIMINGRSTDVSTDGRFEGPYLIAPGDAAANSVGSDDASHIVLELPPVPTTISATVGDITESIQVYYYEPFVRMYRTCNMIGSSETCPGYPAQITRVDEGWNALFLQSSPLWGGRYWTTTSCGDSTGWVNESSDDVFVQSHRFIDGRTVEEHTQGYVIRVPPWPEGGQEPLVLILSCSFVETLWGLGQKTLALSQYSINGQPLHALGWSQVDGAGSYDCWILLPNCAANEEITLSATSLSYYNPGLPAAYGHVNSYFSFQSVRVPTVFVSSIEASCPKADNSPQSFEGHKTDFGDPCAATSPGQSLIIFYNAVIDANFQVEDFDVTLKANVLPTSITADQLSESWAKAEGPASGSFNRTGTFEVKYQNPKVGGLYKFEFDLGLSGCAKSGANVNLPLACADMTSWLDTETKAVGTWATTHRTATETANYSAIPGVTMCRVYQTWCSLSGSYFDYVFDPVDAQQHAPCRRFQPTIGPNGKYGYVTVNGVVVHGSKINNMMWALFGRYWGWSETSLRLGAHLNQLGRNLRRDGATSQNAIGFGDDIHDNPSANITTILTPANLRTLQVPNTLIEETLWPSPDAADADNSTFTRPTLPTTP